MVDDVVMFKVCLSSVFGFEYATNLRIARALDNLCCHSSQGQQSLHGSPGDGMVKVHNNTIRRKWKEGPRGERVEEGEILKGERRGEERRGERG